MTRYFMKFTPLFAAEVQMMTPPRHQPRRSGRIRSSFRYSADDVRCKDCTRYDSGQPCHLNECVCLEERIEAGVVELNALARECFGGRMFRPLQRRLRDELNRQPFRFFLGDAHRERWTHWKNRCYGMSGRNAAALFLLILTSAVLSSLPNGSLPSFTYGRASDALTFCALLRIPRLRPPSLPSNILMPTAVSLWAFLHPVRDPAAAARHPFLRFAANQISEYGGTIYGL